MPRHEPVPPSKGSAPSFLTRLHLSRAQLCLLAAGTVVTAVLLFSPICFRVNREFWERLMDAAHVPFFAAFTLFVAAVLPARAFSGARRMAIAGALASVTAAMVELIQPLTGRGESLTDLCNGVMGAALAVSGWHAWRCRQPMRLAHAAVAAALMLAVLNPAWRQLRSMQWRRAHFPVLADFESPVEMRLWIASDQEDPYNSRTTVTRSREQASRGEWSMRLDAAVAPWPGARLHCGDADWRGFHAFACDVFNPGDPLTLSIRIDDDTRPQAHAERYNGSREVATGWTRLSIPLEEIARGPKSRALRLQKVRQVILFLDAPKEARTLHFDHLRLER